MTFALGGTLTNVIFIYLVLPILGQSKTNWQSPQPVAAKTIVIKGGSQCRLFSFPLQARVPPQLSTTQLNFNNSLKGENVCQTFTK